MFGWEMYGACEEIHLPAFIIHFIGDDGMREVVKVADVLGMIEWTRRGSFSALLKTLHRAVV